MANISTPIIGVDFLDYPNLIVDIKIKELIDQIPKLQEKSCVAKSNLFSVNIKHQQLKLISQNIRKKIRNHKAEIITQHKRRTLHRDSETTPIHCRDWPISPHLYEKFKKWNRKHDRNKLYIDQAQAHGHHHYTWSRRVITEEWSLSYIKAERFY